MPGPRAVSIEVSEGQRQILEQLVRQRQSGQGLVSRAQIILEAAAGSSNAMISRRLEQNRLTVRLWRHRWGQAQEALAAVEAAQDKDQPLTKAIAQVLSDAWRSGRPDIFSAEQVVQLIAISCEDPAASGLSITTWTPKDIAQEAMRRGIVDHISAQSVERFLKGGRSATAPGQILAER
jgi:putative transposase